MSYCRNCKVNIASRDYKCPNCGTDLRFLQNNRPALLIVGVVTWLAAIWSLLGGIELLLFLRNDATGATLAAAFTRYSTLDISTTSSAEISGLVFFILGLVYSVLTWGYMRSKSWARVAGFGTAIFLMAFNTAQIILTRATGYAPAALIGIIFSILIAFFLTQPKLRNPI